MSVPRTSAEPISFRVNGAWHHVALGPFHSSVVTGAEQFDAEMANVEAACNRAQKRMRRPNVCDYCGAPPAGKCCRYCGTERR